MKNLQLASSTIAILSLFTSWNLYAFKVVIFTDQEGGVRAREQLERFDTIPLNEFAITYEIVYVPPETLSCRVTNDPVEGMADCDRRYINRRTRELNGDQAMVVSSVGSRGAGGDIPVIPVQRPLGSMLHEFSHALGLDDEYAYEADITHHYCNSSLSSLNIAAFPPRPPYSNDSQARSRHSHQIPWFHYIAATTPITGPESPISLGTPVSFEGNIGLYPGSTCNNATPRIDTWKPGNSPNVMSDMDYDYGPELQTIVRSILEQRGVRRQSTSYRLEESFFGLVKKCFLIDDATKGNRIHRRVPRRRCQQSPDPANIFDSNIRAHSKEVLDSTINDNASKPSVQEQ